MFVVPEEGVPGALEVGGGVLVVVGCDESGDGGEFFGGGEGAVGVVFGDEGVGDGGCELVPAAGDVAGEDGDVVGEAISDVVEGGVWVSEGTDLWPGVGGVPVADAVGEVE